ncbi:MAG: hypothetical protein NW208_04115 [Bryobacter sp.]|nr:hypothetical protein [Bryobacter sp.]
MRDRYPVPELTQLAERLGVRPFALLYLHAKRNVLAFATTTPPPGGGIFQEVAESCVELPFDCTDEALGEAVWQKLLEFRLAPMGYLSKWTDAPSFRRSRMKTVRRFRFEYVSIWIEAYPQVLRLTGNLPPGPAEHYFVGIDLPIASDFSTLGSTGRAIRRGVALLAESDSFPEGDL